MDEVGISDDKQLSTVPPPFADQSHEAAPRRTGHPPPNATSRLTLACS